MAYGAAIGAGIAAVGALAANSKAKDAGAIRIRKNSTLNLDSQLRFLEFLELGGDPTTLLQTFGKKEKRRARGDPNLFKLGSNFFRRPDEATVQRLRNKRETTFTTLPDSPATSRMLSVTRIVSSGFTVRSIHVA